MLRVMYSSGWLSYVQSSATLTKGRRATLTAGRRAVTLTTGRRAHHGGERHSPRGRATLSTGRRDTHYGAARNSPRGGARHSLRTTTTDHHHGPRHSPRGTTLTTGSLTMAYRRIIFVPPLRFSRIFISLLIFFFFTGCKTENRIFTITTWLERI